MCGIAGIVGPGRQRPEMDAMLDLIRHRGPDGSGQWSDGHACLGMRRLSIIDLATGDQPMLAEDGRVGLVYNGEIYNYVELRDQLRARGHEFRTNSDTEVLLRAYVEYGLDCLEHLRGMFAFAIWDARRRRLFVARDRFGKKPLYHGWRGNDFVFCSELKALARLPGVRLEIDPLALAQYFRYQYVPAPRSIFRGFSKLPAGTAMVLEAATPSRVDRGRLRTWRYWSPPYDARPPDRVGPDEALERLRHHLAESVLLRMRSDVPVGSLLSGGLDSSVITALMARETSQRVRTFSVGFPGAGGLDESGAARVVAEFLGTDHHELMVEGNAVELLPTVAYHLDEPFADAAALPTYQIAAVASRHVKVVLSGEGADEVFGGYRYLRTLHYTANVERLPRQLRRALADLGAPLTIARAGALPARLGRILCSLPDDLPARYRKVVSLFDDTTRLRLLGPLVPEIVTAGDPEATLPDRRAVPGSLDWLLAALSTTWLPDDLLMKVDKMTMAVGLEARTPFLDHRLVESMARLPAGYKVQRQTAKVLLRRLAAELLPPEIVNRPKHGFDVPLDSWFRGELRPLLMDTVASRSIREAGLLDPKVVRQIAAAHLDGRRECGRQLWAILCFQLWYERFLGASAQDTGEPLSCVAG